MLSANGHRISEPALTGYGARRRSPIGLGGTVAVHALVVGAFLLMPKEVIDLVRPTPPISGYPIPLPPPPTPDPVKQVDKPIQTDPLPTRATATDPIRPLPVPDTGLSDGGHSSPYDGNGTDILPPPPPPPAHVPVLVEASISPGAIAGFQPDYPGAMIRQGLDGSVTVRVTIGPDGRVAAIERVSATDEAFWLVTQRHALRTWRFRPATRDGVAVTSNKVLTVRFTLTER